MSTEQIPLYIAIVLAVVLLGAIVRYGGALKGKIKTKNGEMEFDGSNAPTPGVVVKNAEAGSASIKDQTGRGVSVDGLKSKGKLDVTNENPSDPKA